MTELRFPKSVYPGEHVDEALKLYARFGSFERSEEDDTWIVRVEASTPARERRLAGELGNYALGLVVQNRIVIEKRS